MARVEISCTERGIEPLRLFHAGEELVLVERSPTRQSATAWEGEVTAADGRRFHLHYSRATGWQVRPLGA